METETSQRSDGHGEEEEEVEERREAPRRGEDKAAEPPAGAAAPGAPPESPRLGIYTKSHSHVQGLRVK